MPEKQTTTRSLNVQAAVDVLAEEIKNNGEEMLGESVFDEPEWHALREVASALGASMPPAQY